MFCWTLPAPYLIYQMVWGDASLWRTEEGDTSMLFLCTLAVLCPGAIILGGLAIFEDMSTSKHRIRILADCIWILLGVSGIVVAATYLIALSQQSYTFY